MSIVTAQPYGTLTGAQKAAILILAIGDDQRKRIFTLLDEDEIREISISMVKLGSIQAAIVEQLCAEFAASVGDPNGLAGGLESTERLLLKNLPPDRVAQILEEIRGPAGRTMWDKLGNVGGSVLAGFLKNEYPQTVAVVMSKITPDRAAKVLAELPETFASEVVMRLLRMETVQKDVLDSVERTLRSEFLSNLARTDRGDPHEKMAHIFNNLDGKSEKRFLLALERRDQDAADRVRALMFTFEDLRRIPAQGIQVLLRGVQKNRIALALKGASTEMKELFFKNLSDRAGKMLREEIEGLGPVKLRDVEDARAELVRVAKELAGQGRIEIKVGSAVEDEVVY
jgi:flagellar motor switch protein FliG